MPPTQYKRLSWLAGMLVLSWAAWLHQWGSIWLPYLALKGGCWGAVRTCHLISCGCVLLICITTWSWIVSCHKKWSSVTVVHVDIKADALWFYFLNLLWGWDYTCGFCVWYPLKSGALKPSREFRLLHVKITSMCLLVSLPVLCTDMLVSHNQQSRLCY